MAWVRVLSHAFARVCHISGFVMLSLMVFWHLGGCVVYARGMQTNGVNDWDLCTMYYI